MTGIKKHTFPTKLQQRQFLAIFNSVSKDFMYDAGLSGGDRIVIELSKIWQTKFKKFEYLTCTSGFQVLKKYIPAITSKHIYIIKTPSFLYKNIFLLYLWKTSKSIIFSLFFSMPPRSILFSSSDFFPDVIPALILKLRNRDSIWISAFYFFASSPFSPEFPYKSFRLKIRGAVYYFTQKIAYFFIIRFADYVMLCNEIDKKIFVKDGFPAKNLSAIYGGVHLMEAQSVAEPSVKKYDAVFMARFHPQKGPLVILESWRQVLKSLPQAKLLMIGNGLQEKEVNRYLQKHRTLASHVSRITFIDGKDKYAVLKSAKVFVHSAVYETGGMAAAEGMAAGLPVVAFDHEGFDYCYPMGMLRVAPIGSSKKLAEAIVMLLTNEKEYLKYKSQAISLIQSWDWNTRSDFLLKEFQKL